MRKKKRIEEIIDHGGSGAISVSSISKQNRIRNCSKDSISLIGEPHGSAPARGTVSN